MIQIPDENGNPINIIPDTEGMDHQPEEQKVSYFPTGIGSDDCEGLYDHLKTDPAPTSVEHRTIVALESRVIELQQRVDELSMKLNDCDQRYLEFCEVNRQNHSDVSSFLKGFSEIQEAHHKQILTVEQRVDLLSSVLQDLLEIVKFLEKQISKRPFLRSLFGG